MANITNLSVNGPIKIGGEKVIALNQQNIDLLKQGYNNDPVIVAAKGAVSNKDLLSQSFAAPVESATPVLDVVPPVIDVTPATNEAAPLAESIVAGDNVQPEVSVQLTGIPPVQNTTNLESAPANMSMEATSVSEDNTMDPLSGLENVIPNTNLNVVPLATETVEPSVTENNIESATETVETSSALEIPGTEIKVSEPVVESPFQVTDAPNIFDQPVEVTNVLPSETVSAPGNVTEEKKLETTEPVDPLNIFAVPEQSNIKMESEIKEETVPPTILGVQNELTNDILQVEIALEKEAADLFDKLAQNSRKKIELLEQKKKTTKEIEKTSEPSASDLFNTNGVLDDNKVLEESNDNILKLVA